MKDEIIQKLKTNTHTIDYSIESYYFTLSVNSFMIQKLSSITSCLITSDYKNLEYFKFPPFNDYITRTYQVEYNDYTLPESLTYYYTDSDKTHLYQIYHIKGQATRVEVRNDKTNTKEYFDLAINWNIPPPTVNSSIPSFYVYLFNKIDSVKFDSQLSGFHTWMYEFP